ncbi:MAG: HPF/RaiA family ribosome-associated protein [Solirubrobacterales bacterium]|nr:HPF/RaiA family ribosome-associated protein [Solirubrobacterales bacterium]
MQIEIVGRGYEVDGDCRESIRKRFDRVSRQVSEHARLEVVLREETNPAIREKYVAEATLRLKRATLHAEERSEKMDHSIKEVSLDIRRQVKRHRELRRKRTTTRRLMARMRNREA